MGVMDRVRVTVGFRVGVRVRVTVGVPPCNLNPTLTLWVPPP